MAFYLGRIQLLNVIPGADLKQKNKKMKYQDQWCSILKII